VESGNCARLRVATTCTHFRSHIGSSPEISIHRDRRILSASYEDSSNFRGTRSARSWLQRKYRGSPSPSGIIFARRLCARIRYRVHRDGHTRMISFSGSELHRSCSSLGFDFEFDQPADPALTQVFPGRVRDSVPHARSERSV
jgi:hypothetical protein